LGFGAILSPCTHRDKLPAVMSATTLQIIGMVGGCALVGSVAAFTLKWRRFARWKNATGTVIQLTPKSDSEGGGTWEARIEFTTHTGDMVRFTNRVTTNPPVAKVGEFVPIIYDPNSPADATVNRFMHRHLPELLAFAVGVVASLIFIFQSKVH
jgi:hypothetical protein